jgi:hexosaminidase
MPHPRPAAADSAGALCHLAGSTAALIASAVLLSSCATTGRGRPPATTAAAAAPMHSVIPAPASIELPPGTPFSVSAATTIVVRAGGEDVRRIAGVLGKLLEPAAGTTIAVTGGSGAPVTGTISLGTDAPDASLGEEGYELTVGADGVRLAARTAAGLFYGVQTLRQLLPPWIEYRAVRPRPLAIPAARIVDRPRFAWRGAMLDVARHFFTVEDVERYVDLLALYKINRLHLHLSDDQGWRIEIRSWPNLALHGGRTEVGGGPGGFYTQEQYAELVRYAAERFITIVPEIDLPGHTNAALAAYAELNCDGKAREPYTGIEVGFSALCVEKDVTYRFITDVVREIAALTPGPYFHIGGDEVKTLSPDHYRQFIERVQGIVEAQGKRVIGWDEIAQVRRLPTTLVQHWRPDFSHGSERMPLILSPAHKVYLDMRYDTETVLGQDWAGRIEVRDAYDWNPVELAGVPESSIVGVEAPIWSETLETMADVEFMAFPRLPAVAEVGWSPQGQRRWEDFRERLAAQAPRWSALGVNAYRSPQVPWRASGARGQ